MGLAFDIHHRDQKTGARAGIIHTAHGSFETPAFMAVGTQGTVKGLTPDQIAATGTSVVLGNTYHLMLRPGSERIAQLGGLHRFMAWDGPILTDSGGFQVFSLADLNRITEEGVLFQSHIDGSRIMLTPERSMQIQADLGSDIVMAFDDCAPYPCSRQTLRAAMDRTHGWAERCLNAPRGAHQALFGIVQGGMEEDLRVLSARTLAAMPFDGLAVGGLSVGEPPALRDRILGLTTPWLPKEKPVYLMGVGTPRDLAVSVSLGVDMFDCVMPTRNGRNGQAFTRTGVLPIKQARFRDDERPLDPDCHCMACTRFSRAYLHHVFRAKEMLACVLLSLHNLTYYQDLMTSMRKAIQENQMDALLDEILSIYGPANPGPLEAS